MSEIYLMKNRGILKRKPRYFASGTWTRNSYAWDYDTELYLKKTFLIPKDTSLHDSGRYFNKLYRIYVKE